MKELEKDNHIFNFNAEDTFAKGLNSSDSLKEFEEIHKKAKQLIHEKSKTDDFIDEFDDPSPKNHHHDDSFGFKNNETGTFKSKHLMKAEAQRSSIKKGLPAPTYDNIDDQKPRKTWDKKPAQAFNDIHPEPAYKISNFYSQDESDESSQSYMHPFASKQKADAYSHNMNYGKPPIKRPQHKNDDEWYGNSQSDYQEGMDTWGQPPKQNEYNYQSRYKQVSWIYSF